MLSSRGFHKLPQQREARARLNGYSLQASDKDVTISSCLKLPAEREARAGEYEQLANRAARMPPSLSVWLRNYESELLQLLFYPTTPYLHNQLLAFFLSMYSSFQRGWYDMYTMGAPRSFRYDSLANKLSQFSLPKMHSNVMSIVKVEHLDDDEIVMIQSRVGFSYVLLSQHKVETMEKLKQRIEAWCTQSVDKFIMPKKQAAFAETLGARFYKKHDAKITDTWMPYAVPTGHEYAFLALLKPKDQKDEPE